MKAEAALRSLAEQHNLPCSICKEVHRKRPTQNGFVSWASPVDGHYYHEMSATAFASWALDQIEKADA